MATTRLVDPTAYAPSRIALGTARIASSDSELMSGVIRMPTTMPAPRALKSWVSFTIPSSWRVGMIESSAKNPSTIVGMPASSSSTGFTVRRTRSGAYSER